MTEPPVFPSDPQRADFPIQGSRWAAARVDKARGCFVDKKLEYLYRLSNLHADTDLIRVCLAFIALFMPTFSFTDYSIYGPSGIFIGLGFFRIVIWLAVVWVIVKLPKVRTPKNFDTLVIATTIGLSAFLIINDWVRPKGFVIHHLIDAMLLFVVYIVFISRFWAQILVAVSFSAFIFMFSLVHDENSAMLRTLLGTLIIANITGIHAIGRLHYLRRKAFASQKHIKFQSSRLKFLAYRDPLTKLLNRNALRRNGLDAEERFSRYGQPFSVVLLDLDYFKKINDQYGHLVGDTLLEEFSVLLQKEARNVDQIYRFGGEEFLLIMPGTKLDEAEVFAKRVYDLMQRKVFLINSFDIKMTVSIGIGEVTSKCKSMEKLLQITDDALYRAKKEGRNCIRIAHSEST